VDLNLNFNLSDMPTEHKATTLNPETVYDVLILGGGPAALTTAVYCMRKGVRTGLLTENIGGQVRDTSTVENYMGYKYIEGTELVHKFHEQVQQFEIGYQEENPALRIEQGQLKKVTAQDGQLFRAKTVIVATGKKPRWLNVPGEKEFVGRGVTICATCDAPLYKDKKVVVVGGGNSGVEAVIDLAKIAKKVTLIQFLDKLTADQILIDKLVQFDNISILYKHEVKAIIGSDNLETILVLDRKTDREHRIDTQGVFVEIGWLPNSDLVKGVLKLNNWNEIIIDCACRTNQPGIFAAGDVTSVPYKQIITAAGDGAKAALSACEYVLKMKTN